MQVDHNKCGDCATLQQQSHLAAVLHAVGSVHGQASKPHHTRDNLVFASLANDVIEQEPKSDKTGVCAQDLVTSCMPHILITSCMSPDLISSRMSQDLISGFMSHHLITSCMSNDLITSSMSHETTHVRTHLHSTEKAVPHCICCSFWGQVIMLEDSHSQRCCCWFQLPCSLPT